MSVLASAAGDLLGVLGGPVTRDGARDEARRELSKGIYQDARPGWFSRAVGWVNDALADLWNWFTPDPDSGIGGFKGLGVLGLVAVLVALVVVVRLWLGPVRRSARDDAGETTPSGPLTAADLRAMSRAQAEDGAYADAVRSRLRAIARMLEERGMLDPKPGRTAGELISDLRAATAPTAPTVPPTPASAGPPATAPAPPATAPLPSPGPGPVGTDAGGERVDPFAALSAAVDVFSEIWYGGRPATRQALEVIVRADEELGRLRRGEFRARPDSGSYSVPA